MGSLVLRKGVANKAVDVHSSIVIGDPFGSMKARVGYKGVGDIWLPGSSLSESYKVTYPPGAPYPGFHGEEIRWGTLWGGGGRF